MLLLFKHPDSCYRRYCDYKWYCGSKCSFRRTQS